jgi:hypothetical protein
VLSIGFEPYFPSPPLRPQVFFSYGDITEAHTLDPFTHVYMFDIGFPPNLFYEIADRFNRSRCSKWLTCFHGPRLIIDRYGFDVEYLAQCPTSMHGRLSSGTATLCGSQHRYKADIVLTRA